MRKKNEKWQITVTVKYTDPNKETSTLALEVFESTERNAKNAIKRLNKNFFDYLNPKDKEKTSDDIVLMSENGVILVNDFYHVSTVLTKILEDGSLVTIN